MTTCPLELHGVIGGTGGGSPAFVQETFARPGDWLALPKGGTEEVNLLVALHDHDNNHAAVKMTVNVGTYDVDWGDGTSSLAVASNTQIDHTYDYATAGGLTTQGFKQRVVVVTPTTGGSTLTTVNIGPKPAAAGSGTWTQPWVEMWADIPSCTDLLINNFANCRALRKIDLANIGNLSTWASKFNGLTGLEEVLFGAGTLTNSMSFASAFFGCGALINVGFPTGSLALVTSCYRMFYECYALRSITWPTGSLVSPTTCQQMFYSCRSLRQQVYPVGSLSTTTTLNACFRFCGALELITFPAGSLAAVNNLGDTFQSCHSLKTIDFPSGSLSAITTFSGMFNFCNSLKEVVFPTGSMASGVNSTNMFIDCSSLQSVTFPSGSFAAVNNTTAMFRRCESLNRIEFPTGSLTLVTNASSMFRDCTFLDEIILPTGCFPLVTNTANMFAGATSNVSRIQNMEIPSTFSIGTQQFEAAELDEVYTSLPTVVGQTVTVSNNPGTATHTTSIATLKGWTVTA